MDQPTLDRVIRLPLAAIDLDDQTWRFRAQLRTGPLAESLARDGQQIPIVVRARGERYQLISGFRRCTALRANKAEHVLAIVREGLDEHAAFRASVLENSQRKTYSDIDRALAMRAARERGFDSADVAEMMGLTQVQADRVESLLDLPPEVQVAIDDPDNRFGATHALTLARLRRNHYPDLQYREWIDAVNRDDLSVAAMTRAVNARYGADEPSSVPSLFDEATDQDAGVFRLKAVRIEVARLSDEERRRVASELRWLLEALEGGTEQPAQSR